ncbi:MAG: type II toxin-antitoxin system RelE/ParE family toxin [Alphaproteobacteria bacterium]|nr:type II toxin-antitoxin system RelE/ParE family toxin [Alphaproteobacteria bacterium]
MAWQVEFTAKADKQFAKLDRHTQQAIVKYLERVIESDDPTLFGKALVGEFSGLWRYRVGKYRIICDLQQQRLIVEVVRIGKRNSVYD